MNLDDELRRVLADDRLGVDVAPGAEERIVAGAQRLRRRRMATASTVGGLTVAVLVGGGIVLANVSRDDALPPADRISTTAPTTTTTTAPTTTSSQSAPTTAHSDAPESPDRTSVSTKTVPPKPRGAQLGPASFGVLSLGMSFADAVAAGGTEGQPPSAGACANGYPLLVDGEPAGQVSFGADGGITMLAPTGDVHTAEGASVGWTVEQVKAVYPELADWDSSGNITSVTVPGNPSAIYMLEFADGVLSSINLQTGEVCAG